MADWALKLAKSQKSSPVGGVLALAVEHRCIDALMPYAKNARILLPKASTEPGRWRTSRTPYMREPMDELSPMSTTERVVLMFAAQTGKSSAGENWLGYVVHHAPGPMMLVQPTVETAKRFSKQRVLPMIADAPVLRGRIAESLSRDSSGLYQEAAPAGGVGAGN